VDPTREVGVSSPVRWQWADVEASVAGSTTVLRHLVDGATLSVRNDRLVRGPGYSSAGREVRQQLARVGAILRLRNRGRYFIHASGAVDPAGRAWLMTGDTGSGKSTLAFALSRAGWQILGDDGVVMEHMPLGTVAHAWREPLRVSLELSRRYPMLEEIIELPASCDERRRVPVHACMARRAPIAGVLLLEQSPVTRLVRVAPATALAALVRQSPWVLLADAAAAGHYRALQSVARAVPVFEFAHSSAQLDTLADTLCEAA